MRAIVRYLLFCLLLTCFGIGKAQLWEGVGGGCSSDVRNLYYEKDADVLYVVGAFNYADDSLVGGIATWDGSQWGTFSIGIGDPLLQPATNPIRSVAKFNGDVFVGGSMRTMSGDTGIYSISRWDGVRWNACGNPNSSAQIEITNGNLFALGSFSSIGGQPIEEIAIWNGSEWSRFGDSVDFDNGGAAFCSEYYKGEYYFGGSIGINGTTKSIIR
jgi:hypothetical protein